MKRSNISLLITILFTLTFFYAASHSGYTVMFVPTDSMAPTINKKDLILCKKIHDATDVKHGDIVVFLGKTTDEESQPDEEIFYVKRVTGLVGDLKTNATGQVIKVPAHSFFVEGDNAANSLDSRYFGAVSADKIKYRVKGSMKNLVALILFTLCILALQQFIEKIMDYASGMRNRKT